MRSPTACEDAAETAAAHNDPDSWVVVQHCAKRILERLNKASQSRYERIWGLESSPIGFETPSVSSARS